MSIASEPPGARLRWRLAAGLLIALSAGLHLVYLARACPLDLAQDEAHYWDWSRHLDWSYYSKGPLVAYLIRLGCALAGDWSRALTTTDMLAVRLPAVACGSLLLVSLYLLTALVYRRESLAFAVVALALTSPAVVAGSTLMTIDAPYTCCWGWALVLGYHALVRCRPWAWPLLGIVVGLGILAKYTMVLWLPSAVLFLLTTPPLRRRLTRPGFWIMLALVALLCVPILIWNVAHDWVSWRHVSGQAGLHDPQGILWLGPLDYLFTQFLVLLGFWFVVWAAAMICHRPWREPDVGMRYLWWMSAPMFLVFLGFSVKTHVELNWPITAYLSGLVLAAGWLRAQLQSAHLGSRRAAQIGLVSSSLLAIFLIVLMHHSEWFQGTLVRLGGRATPQNPLPRRRLDPTCRLRGWRTLAAALDRLREELRTTGQEPYLAATCWNVPGEIGFYCQGQPIVYSFGLVLGTDRHSQYDLWHPNPAAEPERFRGGTFVVVGEVTALLSGAFERLEPSQVVTHAEAGEPVARWTVTVCRGFRGFPRLPEATPQAPF